MVLPSILHISSNIRNTLLTFDDIHSFYDHFEASSSHFEVLLYQYAQKYMVEWLKVRRPHMLDGQRSCQ